MQSSIWKTSWKRKDTTKESLAIYYKTIKDQINGDENRIRQKESKERANNKYSDSRNDHISRKSNKWFGKRKERIIERMAIKDS